MCLNMSFKVKKIQNILKITTRTTVFMIGGHLGWGQTFGLEVLPSKDMIIPLLCSYYVYH